MYRIIFILLLFPIVAQSQSWTLEQCIQRAWDSNIQLHQAELNEQNVQLNEWTAMGAMLPSLNGQATHGYNWGQRIDPFTNSFASQRIQSNSFGISSSIDLFTGGQNWCNYQKVKDDVAAAHWTLENSRNQVALQTANAFLNVVLTSELEKIAASTMSSSQENLNRVQKQFSIGTVNESTLADIEAQSKSDAANWITAKNNYHLSVLALTQLLQLNPEESQNFIPSFPDLSLFAMDEVLPPKSLVLSTALGEQPSIKSAMFKVNSAEWAEKTARGALMPRVSASMSYGTGYSGAAKILTGSGSQMSFPIGTVGATNDWVFSLPQTVYSSSDYSLKPFNSQMRDNVNRSIFLSLTMPIFNGFQTQTQIKRAQINYKNAEWDLLSARQKLVTDVETAYANTEAARQTYQAQLSSKEANEKSYHMAVVRFENGLINATEMSIARNRWDIAKAQLIRSQLDFVFKRNILKFYMNQPIQLQP